MYVSAHGGGCCGVFHLHGFGDTQGMSVTQIKATVTSALNRTRHIDAGNKGRLIEVCLTDRQLDGTPERLTALTEMGFVNVSSFRNSNSGNTVHIFHLMLNGIDRTPNAPIRIRRVPFLKYFTRLFRR